MKKKYIILAAANAASLLTFAVLALILSLLVRSLPSQRASERWGPSGDVRYSQFSVFYSALDGIDVNEVYRMRADIDKKLTQNSVKPVSDKARIWIDAYSSQSVITVSSPRDKNTVNAQALVTATGGDYFIFHPLKLISGCYYSDGDLMQDRVILDENLAWQLFGSGNIDGMTVVINGKRFYIAGVVRPEEDKASSAVYGSKPHIYMSYSGLEQVINAPPIITCYEAVLPDPVTGLAGNIITEAVSPGESGGIVILENSSRFSLKSLFKVAFDGGKRAVVDKPVVYPFWENAARITEERASVLLVWTASMLLLPVFTVIYFAVKLYRRRKKLLHKAAEGIKGAAERLTVKQREKINRQSVHS